MLFPENVNDVRKIILEARETGKGLVPVSSGPPHIHGGSENPDAETVCFSRMDRIIKIDRRSRYCRIEPGVTFGDLIPRLAESGMRLNMPFLPRANKSVVA
ncbi:MAG: FAD-binding protein, partial [Lachnospiraceae bacterium]|nr:FAD-binding protein [Lachnospiraceae bacterium]